MLNCLFMDYNVLGIGQCPIAENKHNSCFDQFDYFLQQVSESIMHWI